MPFLGDVVTTRLSNQSKLHGEISLDIVSFYNS